jgi:hypothetical protein
MNSSGKMSVFGRAAVAEFLGDNIVYRNLKPVDERLPGLDEVRTKAGLPSGGIPRKTDPAYASVIVHLLKRGRALENPKMEIRRLVFVGDTRMNDGTAFANICEAGAWPGMAFIAAEDAEPAAKEVVAAGTSRSLYLANRWAALADFEGFCAEQNFHIDEATAVVVDLDKTALGARGRNARAIDQARVQAVKDTVAGLLGQAFDHGAFRRAYDELNQVEYHPFTRDNQDYLAYICLILGSGLYDLQTVVADVKEDRLRAFEAFIEHVNGRAGELPQRLAEIHHEIYGRVRMGDPTPFKAFRRNEYLTTIGRMGFMSDDLPVEDLLELEIVITQEVREIARKWREQGAFLFGLSDKPDEASIPTEELAAQGYLPIHQAETHAVGEWAFNTKLS